LGVVGKGERRSTRMGIERRPHKTLCRTRGGDTGGRRGKGQSKGSAALPSSNMLVGKKMRSLKRPKTGTPQSTGDTSSKRTNVLSYLQRWRGKKTFTFIGIGNLSSEEGVRIFT